MTSVTFNDSVHDTLTQAKRTPNRKSDSLGGYHKDVVNGQAYSTHKHVVNISADGHQGSRKNTKHKVWQSFVTISVCLMWTVVSSSAILVNKHIMVDLKFRYPTTIAWFGLLTTTIASAVCMRVVVPKSEWVGLTTSQYMRRALPTGFCMALTFQTGNLAYLYLTVAFIQMLKAFCPVITMVLLFMFRLEKPTRRLVASVMIICCGVALASWGELNMSWFGLTSMLISVVAESVRLVLTQHLLVGYTSQMHPLEGLYYISSACTMCLTVQSCIWELGGILRTGSVGVMMAFPGHFMVAACAGFGVNLLAILVIKLASSLTLKVLGTVKDAVLVTVGVVFLHEHVSKTQLNGYSISVVGFILYNLIKAGVNFGSSGGTYASPSSSLPPLPLSQLKSKPPGQQPLLSHTHTNGKAA